MKDKEKDQSNIYADMLRLPHHVSRRRSQMSIRDRAAQFAPFSAVVGHEAATKEVARDTDARKELDETEKEIINDQLREIEEQLPSDSDVKIVYFEPDILKSGGAYVVKIGKIKKIDKYTKEICMLDGTRIEIREICSVLNNYLEFEHLVPVGDG